MGSIATHEKKNYLQYSASMKEDESIRAMFRHLTAEEAFLSPETPFDELGYKCGKAILLLRFAFEVAILPSNDKKNDNDKFAIIVTMPHVVGDGDTYYAIYHAHEWSKHCVIGS